MGAENKPVRDFGYEDGLKDSCFYLLSRREKDVLPDFLLECKQRDTWVRTTLFGSSGLKKIAGPQTKLLLVSACR